MDKPSPWHAQGRLAALLTGRHSAPLGGMVGMMWSGGLDVIEGRWRRRARSVCFLCGDGSTAFTHCPVLVICTAAGAAERLMELLAETSEIADTGTLSAASQRVLSFDKAHFAYRRRHPALQDFGLDIEHGESVALVGPSGAGKSAVFG